MTAIPTLEARLDSADAVLRSITRLERSNRKNRRTSPAEFRSISAIRAGVYVMVYNAVENAVRESFSNIRTTIQNQGVPFSEAREFWQHDFVRVSFLDKMQSGTNHGNVLSAFVPATNAHLSWDPNRIADLPITGNFGQTAAQQLTRRLPLANWRAPAHSANGADLEIVRTTRNDLAHGFEAYEDVGRVITTLRMYEIVSRTRIYMVSLIGAIEQYQAAQEYLRP
jgi:hypothetical protein